MKFSVNGVLEKCKMTRNVGRQRKFTARKFPFLFKIRRLAGGYSRIRTVVDDQHDNDCFFFGNLSELCCFYLPVVGNRIQYIGIVYSCGVCAFVASQV